MKKALSFFKKRKGNPGNNTTATPKQEVKIRYTEEEMLISLLNKQVVVHYPSDLTDQLQTFIADLNTTLKINQNDLFIASINNAIEYMEMTGEAFHIMFDPEDTDEAEDFLNLWNCGDTSGLLIS